MSLSWTKEEGGLGIALTNSNDRMKNNKILYLNKNKNSDVAIKYKRPITEDFISEFIPSRKQNRLKTIRKIVSHLTKNTKIDENDFDVLEVVEKIKKLPEENKIVLPEGTTFELLPIMPKDALNGNIRSTLFVSGMAGSGKTYLCQNYIKLYNEIYETNKIFFISQQNKDLDPSLKDVKGLMTQISIEDLLNEDDKKITWESFTSKPCLLFFDDFDGFSDVKENKKDKYTPLNKVMTLINDILRNGRKFGISCLISSHDLNKANKMETILKECEYICIFPAGIMLYHLNYFGTKYLGFDKKQIHNMKNDNSRWIIIRRMNPIVMLTEYECKLL